MNSPKDSYQEFRYEESLLNALSDWEGDPFESESGCISAVSKVKSLSATEDDLSETTQVSNSESVDFPQFKIGPYRLIGKLGQGGMGRVFRARHERLDRVVALKVLSPASRTEPAISRRFRREMQALGKISHPNIVAATDGGVRDGVHFLAMELIEGVTFSQLLRANGKLSIADACELVRQAAIGLGAAHEAGLIHRDVKPSNLMLSMDHRDQATVKILDLGLATICGDAADELTFTGQIVGTLEFMSPEQGHDSHAVDHRSDIYSLGATIAKLLCGKAPRVKNDNLSPVERAVALANQDAPSMATLRDDLPVALVELIDQMQRKDPADRPADMQEVARRLQPFAADHQLRDRFVECPRPTVQAEIAISDLHLIEPASNADRNTISFFDVGSGSDQNDNSARLLYALTLSVSLITILLWWIAWSVLTTNPIELAAASSAPGSANVSSLNNDDTLGLQEANQNNAMNWAISSDLLGYWPIDPTDRKQLSDRSGSGKHSHSYSINALNLNTAAPLQGNPAALNLSSLAMPTAIASDFMLDDNTFSIAFWIKGRPEIRERFNVLGTSDSPSGFDFSLAPHPDRQSSKLLFRMVGGLSDEDSLLDSENDGATISTVINASWHHIVVTYDNSSIKLFADGKLVDSAEQSEFAVADEGSISIGMLSPERRSSIYIDEIVLIDRALQEDEIVFLTRNTLTPAPLSAPADLNRVAEIQLQWADYLDVEFCTENSTGMKLKLVPPGEFDIGTNDQELSYLFGRDKREFMHARYRTESPRHRVRIPNPIYVAITEVTQAQFEEVMGYNPSCFSPEGEKANHVIAQDTADHPAESMTWFQAVEFCNRLSEREGFTPCYRIVGTNVSRMPGNGYRLPTEAEWEYACRAGTESLWSFKRDDNEQHEWSVVTAGKHTHPVAQLRANAFGLHDMHGNVFEWCYDYFADDTYLQRCESLAINPTGPSEGVRRVFRGGSWWQRRLSSRSAFRGRHFPHFQSGEHGFRIVRQIDFP